MENKFWQAGDTVVFRWMIDGKVLIAQPMRVVKDTPEEIALLLVPGATCIVQEGIWQSGVHQSIWNVLKRGTWQMRRHVWHTNRTLMLLRPNDFYSVMLFWEDRTNRFDCHYVNFQLPFTRSHCGFDSFDLELDIVVNPGGAWEWKDEAGYHEGIAAGCILLEWVAAIDEAKTSVIDAIETRKYPFNQTWVDFTPDPRWSIPELPDGWDRV